MNTSCTVCPQYNLVLAEITAGAGSDLRIWAEKGHSVLVRSQLWSQLRLSTQWSVQNHHFFHFVRVLHCPQHSILAKDEALQSTATCGQSAAWQQRDRASAETEVECT